MNTVVGGTGWYHRVRTRMVVTLRRVPGLRAAARAVVADEIGGARRRATRRHRQEPLDISPGRFFAAGKGRQLPIVVVVALGLGEGEAERLAAAVEHAQSLTGSFRPLFVIDRGDFAPFRTRRYGVEHVLPRATYAEVNPHDSYRDYVYGRVASIARSYRCASVVPVSPAMIDDDLAVRLIGVPTS